MDRRAPGILDWLVVGGGIHGVHVAARLVGQADVASERVAIVDPATALLARWRRLSRRTGMRYMRSPVVHHLGLSAYSLRRFLKQLPTRVPLVEEPFTAPYDRPSLELFDAHCDWVVANYGLAATHVRDRVASIDLSGGPARVALTSGREVRARHVVLALGPPPPSLPRWASGAAGHPRVQHIFADDARWPDQPGRVIVVGAGITGAQACLRLVAEGHDVTLVSRHEFRIEQFDSDPGWLGPRNMRGFDRLRCHGARRRQIASARHRGSMPHDVHRALRGALSEGAAVWRRAEVVSLGTSTDRVALGLADGDILEADRVVLATGFGAGRPGGSLVDDLVDRGGLPVADCGFPVVDRSLRWHPRVFVTGPLAELELGPTARNIAGARAAGERIATVASRWASRSGFASRSATAPREAGLRG